MDGDYKEWGEVTCRIEFYLDRDQVWHLQTWQWTWMCEIWGFHNVVVAGEVLGSLSVLTLWKLRCQTSSKRREPLTSENTWILKLEIRTGRNFLIGERRQLLKEIDVAWSYCPLSDGSEVCPVADFREHRAEFLVSVKGGLFIV
jgi:hypothetical protein